MSRVFGQRALRASPFFKGPKQPPIYGPQHTYNFGLYSNRRSFHDSQSLQVVRPYLLADIGEGITQCQIMSWAVKPGDQVQQFDLICEVQSDKASVEITSRFDGTIKKLHYEVDEMAKVGSPLLDIDVEADENEPPTSLDEATASSEAMDQITMNSDVSTATGPTRSVEAAVADRKDDNSGDRVMTLSPVQLSMFQTMTESLKIPHFLYTQILNLTGLTRLRKSILQDGTGPKISALPFVIKALSETILHFPIINCSVDATRSPGPGQGDHVIVEKAAHNIGVAMDTPKGLLVPVIRNVEDHSVESLDKELKRLRDLAAIGKLSTSDMADTTIVVSNIGSIGGHVIAPVILPPTVMILGMGRSREIPVFEKDEHGKDQIVKQEEMVLSWSADHRVLDGATVAKAAQTLGQYLENEQKLDIRIKRWGN